VLTANLWTLAGHPSRSGEWSLARKVRAVAEAGFNAVTAPGSPEIATLCRKHRLRFMGFLSSSEPKDFPSLLAAQRTAGAEVVNAQVGDDFTSPPEGLRLAERLLKEAARQNIYVAIETHRDTATETPEKTYWIADAYQRRTGLKMPLTWDHSHFAVVKHLKPGLFEETLLQRRDLIEAARIFHLRPFNGQHAQVPVMDARNRLTREFRTWRPFAEALLKIWVRGARPGGELWVVPEIGPVGAHGYNLSIMKPSWDQTLRCKTEIIRLWSKACLSYSDQS
jgi:hypothetical protein